MFKDNKRNTKPRCYFICFNLAIKTPDSCFGVSIVISLEYILHPILVFCCSLFGLVFVFLRHPVTDLVFLTAFPPDDVSWSYLQKQPSRGVLKKRCSENIQQIYRRTPMSPMCQSFTHVTYFNKVARQLEIALQHGCSPVILLIFLEHFFQEHLSRATSVIKTFYVRSIYILCPGNCVFFLMFILQEPVALGC